MSKFTDEMTDVRNRIGSLGEAHAASATNVRAAITASKRRSPTFGAATSTRVSGSSLTGCSRMWMRCGKRRAAPTTATGRRLWSRRR